MLSVVRCQVGGGWSGYVGIKFGFEAGDEGVFIDQVRLGEIDYVADVRLITALQFCQGKVVWFEHPESDFRPYREGPNQTVLVVCGIVGHSDVIDINPVCFLKGGAFTRELNSSLSDVPWNNREYIQIRRFSRKSVVLTDDETADAMQVDGLSEMGVPFCYERKPRLIGTVTRHRRSAWSRCSSARQVASD